MESTRSRKPYLIAIGLVLAWALFLAFFGPRQSRGLEPPLLEGSGLPASADFSWALLDLDDKATDLSRFRGKLLVLNVWATWCAPCREEMPALARLAADPKFRAMGASVVCVSTDESGGSLRRFLEDKKWGMTMLRATSMPPVFATEGIPATFVIAPDGRVAATEIGAARWDDPSVVAFLEKLAAAGP